jgi:multidrug efflux pump subunit AcrB
MKRAFERLAGQHRAVAFAFLLMAADGLYVGLRLPAAILPEVTFPRVKLIVDSGERDTDEMLRAVTMPIEQSIRRVPGLHELRSTTSRGSAEFDLDFAWDTNMDLALQRVQGLAGSIREQLPAGTSLDARLMNPTLFPVLGFSLTSPTRSQAELRDIAELRLRPELARLPGVAEVVLQGGRHLEARVTLDPHALQARGLTVADVAEVVERATELRSVGLLDANRETYLTLVDARPRDLEQLARLPVPVPSAAPVPLGALGQIGLAEAPTFTRYAARPGEAVLINLLRQPSASSVTLSQAVNAWLGAHRSELPKDVRIETFYDQADLVRGAVGSVRDSLLVGGLLAILIVSLFLGSFPLGLAGATILPGSIALTLLGFGLAHQSLNLMTLGGIAAAVGLVLDDAIVVVEHLVHEKDRGRSREEALAELFPTLLASSLCTLAIFVPFTLLGGVAGAFFRVLALSVSVMLAVSLLLCVALLPHLVGAGLTGARPPFPRMGGKSLGMLLPRRGLLMVATAILVALAVAAARGVGSGFLPSMDEGALILDYITPPGTSVDETVRMLAPIERQIEATPEVEAWSRRTGDQLGFFITEPNIGDYAIRLSPRRKRSADAIADDLRERIAAVAPGVDVEFGQLVEDVIGDLTTLPEPIEVRVFGENRELARQTARDAAALMERVPGVVDVRNGIVVSGPNLLLAPSERGSRLGVDAAGLEALARPTVGGVEAGQVPRTARVWPVRVVLPAARPQRAAALLDAAVPLPSGGGAALGELAGTRVVPGDVEILRDDQRSMVSVTARLSGRDLGGAVAAIQRRLRDSLTVAPDVRLEFAGQWAEQRTSFSGLSLVLILATCNVALILLAAFRSWAQTLAVLATALFSLAGVFLALRVSGESFNLSSFVGAIMVVGIVAENAVFVVAAHRRNLARGMEPGEAAAAAAARRVRPVLMTTLAGISALLPLVLGWGSGTALLRPLALAVVGGFAFSAPLLLAVLPSLLRWTRGGLQ